MRELFMIDLTELKRSLLCSISHRRSRKIERDHRLNISSSALFTLSLILMAGCIPEPQLDYPEPAQDFAQEVVAVIPRMDSEPPPLDVEPLDMDVRMDVTLLPELGISQPDTPDAGPPVLRTRSLQFIGDPAERVSSEDVTVYGHFELGHLLRESSTK